MANYARRWSIAIMATTMLGATALSGPAFAQFNGGGGFGGGVGPTGGGGTTGGGTSGATDPGPRGGAPGAGGPLPGLTQTQLAFFTNAQGVFNKVDGVPAPGGLGPRFNLNSCGGCHAQPASGGTSPTTNPQVAVATLMGAKNALPSFITASGPVREVRFIKNSNGTPDGGVHDLFTIAGRSDAPGCNITQPNFAAAVAANNAIFRIPTPTFGLGLVENTTDTQLRSAASAVAQQAGSLGVTSGTFNLSGNDGTITRFGWKAQNKSLLMFAGEAYNVEMGVTNDLFNTERDETPGCAFNPTPEDTENFSDPTPSSSPASDFASDITNFAMFMRLLAPPTPATSGTTPTASSTSPQVASATTSSAITAAASSTPSTTSTTSTTSVSLGQQVFSNIGCAVCHVPAQKTNPVGSALDPTFSNVGFQPFSDFALHTMGTGLADNVSQGNANGQQFRTAPLWGIGQRLFFLHDGRTNNLVTAITQHASSGSEANQVIQNFNQLSQTNQQALVNFLRSL
jgi:CxxC motif-containing protein (DUF1111 family)